MRALATNCYKLSEGLYIAFPPSVLACPRNCCCSGSPGLTVSDHRGSNSQVIDFESIKIYPIFTVKTENPEKSNT
jgi:hypothetical protein